MIILNSILCFSLSWPLLGSAFAGSNLPTYLSLSPNLNGYTRFADGGPDSNWYIGFNNAWIVKLPPSPSGRYARAFIGARIGRAKTSPNANKPWIRELVGGKIYMAISHTASFTSEQSFFLTETKDLPLEADPQAAVDGVGPSDWFWIEIPLGMVSSIKPNYLVIWSPTKSFQNAAASPILAGAAVDETSGETRAWNNNAVLGVPPRTASGALRTPLNNINPALAIKLVPPNEGHVFVTEFSVQPYGRKVVVRFAAEGLGVSEAWLESSQDQLSWERISQPARRPPYFFTVNTDSTPSGTFIRGVARDERGNIGASNAYQVPYVR